MNITFFISDIKPSNYTLYYCALSYLQYELNMYS